MSLCNILWLVLGNQESAISVSWLQSSWGPSAGDQHAVNFFYLVAVSVSAKELRILSRALEGASQVALVVTNFTANAGETRDMGLEDSLESGIAPHSSVLAWKISWAEEHGGLESMGPQRVGHN